MDGIHHIIEMSLNGVTVIGLMLMLMLKFDFNCFRIRISITFLIGKTCPIQMDTNVM